MKTLKTLLLVGAVGIVGIFLKSSSSIDQAQYENELKEAKAESVEFIENSDGLTRELLSVIENKKEEDKYVYEYETVNVESGESRRDFQGYDEGESIVISGNIPGQVFIRKGEERYWIDPDRKIYYHDVFNDYHEDNSPYELNSLESFVYVNFIKFKDKSIEKVDGGYKLTNHDELNSGSYNIYDLSGNLVESYTDNSEGKYLTKLVGKEQNPSEVFDQYKSMTENFTESENRGDFY